MWNSLVASSAQRWRLLSLGAFAWWWWRSDPHRFRRIDGLIGAALSRFRRVALRAPQWYTFCDFMEDSMHDERWGYYTAGRVKFGEKKEGDDFTTFPVTMRPSFGALLADAAHSAWVASGGAGRPFVLVELGCGTGVLAHDVLLRCRDAHPAMYAEVKYVIGERSAALRAIQAETNREFVDAGKLTIAEVDARGHGSGLALRAAVWSALGAAADAERPRGVVLSNELPDAFGVEKLLVGVANGAAADAAAAAERLRVQRCVVVPLVGARRLRELLDAGGSEGDALRGGAEALLTASRLQASAARAAVARGEAEAGQGGAQLHTGAAEALSAWLATEEGSDGEWVALSREAYCNLKARCVGASTEEALDAHVRIAELYVCGAATDAALRQWSALHAEPIATALAAREARGGGGGRLELYANPGLRPLAAVCAAALDDALVITIDYGADMRTLIAGARVVAPGGGTAGGGAAGLRVRSRLELGLPAAEMLYARPGWCDLTADVDFTELAAAGEALGLRPVHYGAQMDLELPAVASVGVPAVSGAGAELRRGVADAFYALGTFMLLVQASGTLADAWRWPVAPLDVARGWPSMASLSAHNTCRALGRICLGHALALQLADAEHAPPSEAALVAALADALVATVPCFRPHWRKMARAVLDLLADETPSPRSQTPHPPPRTPAAAPPLLFRAALRLVRDDLRRLGAQVPSVG